MDWTGVTNTPRFNLSYLYTKIYGDATFDTDMTISYSSRSSGVGRLYMYGDNSVFNGAGLTFGNLNIESDFVTINDDNTFLEIRCANTEAARTIEFEAGSNTTFRRFGALGTSGNELTFISTIPTSSYTLTQDLGTVTFNYCNITDCTAVGGIAFNAYNSTDVSNNTNINFLGGSPAFGGRYCIPVDNSVSWGDVNTWSTVSGGVGGASVPNSSNNVFLDANTNDANFNLKTNQTSNYCNDIDYTGLSVEVNCYGDDISIDYIYIYGNAIFNNFVVTASYRAYHFNFASTSTGNTITTNGMVIDNSFRFVGVGGEWTLQDEIVEGSGAISLRDGTFISDGNNINLNITTSGSEIRGYDLSGSTLTCQTLNFVDATNLTWNAPTLIVAKPSGTSFIALQSLTINNIDFQATTTTIDDNFTASNINFNPNVIVKFTSGITVTVDTITGDGTAGNLCRLESSIAGSPATISKSSGLVEVNYWSIKDSTATGGATFIARDSYEDTGNTGWLFPEDVNIDSVVANTNNAIITPTITNTANINAVVSNVNNIMITPTIINDTYINAIVTNVNSAMITPSISIINDVNINTVVTNVNNAMIPPLIITSYVDAITGNVNSAMIAPLIITDTINAITSNVNSRFIPPTMEVSQNISVPTANANSSMLSAGLGIWEGKLYQCWVSGVEREVTLSDEEREVTITVLTLSKNKVVI